MNIFHASVKKRRPKFAIKNHWKKKFTAYLKMHNTCVRIYQVKENASTLGLLKMKLRMLSKRKSFQWIIGDKNGIRYWIWIRWTKTKLKDLTITTFISVFSALWNALDVGIASDLRIGTSTLQNAVRLCLKRSSRATSRIVFQIKCAKQKTNLETKLMSVNRNKLSLVSSRHKSPLKTTQDKSLPTWMTTI